MPKFNVKNYKKDIKKAVDHFWNKRNSQISNRKKQGQGNRSAVTGGKHLDGFVELMVKVAKDVGIPKEFIYTKGNSLPGYFRPTKDWDLLVINKQNQLVVALEFKSQVGSFGNNFNNRTEEVLGSSVDLWTAFREKAFPQIFQPWIGYLILIEQNDKSTTPVKLKEPHYKVRKEFKNSSYLDRYKILCQKLVLEKHYSATSLIWSNPNKKYGNVEEELSIQNFIESYSSFLIGKLKSFK